MYQKERLESIMALLHRHGYVTVKFLTEELGYSTATVNRDLNMLEQMKRIKRSYGGVEPMEAQAVPLMFRYAKGKPIKKKLGKQAASAVREGDVIFVDGTTTTQYMGQYLLETKDIHVITNNMALSVFLAEHGVSVTVLGGTVAEPPFMLDGPDAVETALRYRADKCFISVSALGGRGDVVGTVEVYYALHRAMLANSERAYLLMDKEKLGHAYSRILCPLSRFDAVISDYAFEDEVKQTCPDTEFILVE